MRRFAPVPTPATILGTRRRNRLTLLHTTALQGSFLVVLSTAAGAQPAPNAHPFGAQLVGGSATVGQTPGATTVQQSSERAALNWGGFDIGSQQTVTFNQPNSSAVVLNRVTGPDPSQIAGHLDANGQVIITNQSGVVFSRGAQVNTAGLVVSSAGITTPNFMAGHMVFDQAGHPNATITNAGTITVRQSGLAALVAPGVANRGVITAKLGRVVLAGAVAHTVDLYGDGLVSIDVSGQVRTAPDGHGGTITALVTNTGTINADGGTILLTARAADGIVQNLVSLGGAVSANTLAGHTGTVIASGVGGALIVDGAVSAAGGGGARGGAIQLATDGDVTLRQGARIDASGGGGGGTIAIGTSLARAGSSNLQARSLSVDAISRSVTIASGASVTADATDNGPGGRISVLARHATAHHGAITARGGPAGGNGGFVELSSLGALSLGGRVDVSARDPFAGAGHILIDPTNLEITDSGTLSTVGTTSYDGSLSSAAVNQLSGAVTLSATNDLLIDRTTMALGTASQTSITLSAGHDLTVDGVIDLDQWPEAGTQEQTLTLSAGNNLSVLSSIAASGPINLLGAMAGAGATAISAPVTAGWEDNRPLTITAGTGGISITGTTGLQGGYDVSSSDVAFATAGPVAASALLYTGSVTGSASSASFTNPANQIHSLGSFTVANSLTLDDGQSFPVTGPLTAGTSVALSAYAEGQALGITVGANITAPSVTLQATGDITQTAGTISTANLTAYAGVNSTDGGSSSTLASVQLPDANQITGLQTASATGSVLIGDAANLAVNGPVTAGTSIALLDGGTTSAASYNLSIAGTLSAPAITLTASGGINEAGGAGALQNPAGGGLVLSGSSGSAGAPGDTSLTGNNAVTTLGSFTSIGGLVLDDGLTGLTVAGPVNVAGGATLAVGTLNFAGALNAGSLAFTALDASQSAGSLTIGSLSGSIVSNDGPSGSITIGTASIDILGALSAPSTVSITDLAALIVQGPVSAGDVTLNVGAQASATAQPLTLTGDITAPVISLTATGDISQTGGTLNAESLLVQAGLAASGSQTVPLIGSATLDGANVVGTLLAGATGNFSLGDTTPLYIGDTLKAANISLRSPSLAISNGSTVAATGLLELAPYDPVTPVVIGSASAGSTGYTLASAAGLSGQTLRIGGTAADLDAPETDIAGATGSLSVLGSFTPGPGFTRLELVSGGPLAVDGQVALAGAGTVALTSTASLGSGAVDVADAGGVSATTISLATPGAATSEGLLAASSLTGSIGSGTLYGIVRVADLDDLSSDTDLSIRDRTPLSVTGTLYAGGALDVAQGYDGEDSGAPPLTTAGITLAGDVSGGSVTLASLLRGIVQSSGVIATASLQVDAARQISLPDANLVGAAQLQAGSALSIANAQSLTLLSAAAGTATVSASVTGALSLAGTVSGGGVALAATSGVSETDGGLIQAGSLAVSTGAGLSADVQLGAANVVGTLLASGAGGSFAFTDALPLVVAGSLTAGGLLSLATTGTGVGAGGGNDLALDAGLTAPSITLLASGAVEGTFPIATTSLSGSADTATLTSAYNSIGTLGSFAAGSLTLQDASGLVIAGPVQAPAIAITATGSLVLAGLLDTDSSSTAAPANGAVLSVLASPAGQAGFTQQAGGGVQPLAGDAASLTVSLPAGGSVDFADLQAPQVALTLDLGSGNASGQLNVASLLLQAAGGSAAFTGSTIDGTAGGGAAPLARIMPAFNASYTLNGCIIDSSTCATPVTPVRPVTPVPPVTPPPPVTPVSPVTPMTPATPGTPVTPVTLVTRSSPTPATPASPAPPVTASLFATADAISAGGRIAAADFTAALANSAFAAVLAASENQNAGVPFINPLQDLSDGPLRDPQRDPDLRLPNVGDRDF